LSDGVVVSTSLTRNYQGEIIMKNEYLTAAALAALGLGAAAGTTTTNVHAATNQATTQNADQNQTALKQAQTAKNTAQKTADAAAKTEKTAKENLTTAQQAQTDADAAVVNAQQNKADATDEGIAAAESDVQTTATTLTAAQADKEKTATAVQDAQNEVDSKSNDVELADANLQDQQGAVDAAQKGVADAPSVADAQKANDDATADLNKAETATTTAKTAKDNADKAVTDASSAVTAAQSEVEDAKKQVTSTEADIKDAQAADNGGQKVNVQLTDAYMQQFKASLDPYYKNDNGTIAGENAQAAEDKKVKAAADKLGFSYTPSTADKNTVIADASNMDADDLLSLNLFIAGILNNIDAQYDGPAESEYEAQNNLPADAQTIVTPNSIKAAQIAVKADSDADWNITEFEKNHKYSAQYYAPSEGANYATAGIPFNQDPLTASDETGSYTQLVTVGAPQDMYLGNQYDGSVTTYTVKNQTLAYWKQAALNQMIDYLSSVDSADYLIENDLGYAGFAIDKWGNLHEVFKEPTLNDITDAYKANPYTIPALNTGVSASTQAKLDSLNKTLTAEKKTLTAAQTALTDAKTALTSAQGAQKTAASNLTEAQTQEAKFREFVGETFQTLKTAQDQTQDADAAAKALSAAQDKLDDLQQIADDATKALNDAQSALQAAQDADQQAQAAVDDAQQASDAAKQHLDDLQNADAKLELAQADASEANEAVVNAQKEYDAAKTANTTAQIALTAAKSALKDAQAKVDATKKEAAGKSGKITANGKHATISTSDTVRASVITTAADAKKTALTPARHCHRWATPPASRAFLHSLVRP
jgi:hypothetical protein